VFRARENVQRNRKRKPWGEKGRRRIESCKERKRNRVRTGVSKPRRVATVMESNLDEKGDGLPLVRSEKEGEKVGRGGTVVGTMPAK